MSDTKSGRKLKRPSVLVVEDESILAEDLKVHLDEMGYHVPAIECEGEKAVDSTIRYKPDVVLMDIGLKGEIDGIEAAQQIRSRYRVPVIFLTAFPERDIVRRASLAEPAGYLLKPVSLESLDATIQLVLNNPATRASEYERDKHGLSIPHAVQEQVGEETSFCYQKLHGLDKPCHKQGIKCPLRELKKSGMPLALVHEHRTLEGESGSMEITVLPMWSFDGAFRGCTVVTRNLPGKSRQNKAGQTSAEADGADSCPNPPEAALSLCSSCSSVLDRAGNWKPMDEYISEHSGTRFSPRLRPGCSNRFRPGQKIPVLSDREKEVLSWIRCGKSTWDISRIMGIKESTVKFHVGRSMQKLGAVTRTQAVVLAMDLGILDNPEIPEIP